MHVSVYKYTELMMYILILYTYTHTLSHTLKSLSILFYAFSVLAVMGNLFFIIASHKPGDDLS